MNLVIAVLGALLNRVRGTYAWKGKIANDLAFGAVMGWAVGDWRLAVALFAAMWAGRSLSWGVEIGRIVNGPVVRGVVELSARGLIWTAAIAVPLKLWDLNWVVVAPAGLLMGPVYAATVALAGRTHRGRGFGWPLGEVAWGLVLWGIVAFGVYNPTWPW